MGIQEKKEELRKYYDDLNFKVFFTEDCENITKIDFELGIVYYFIHETSSCGCCSEIVDKIMDIDLFIEFLTDSDYESLLLGLKSVELQKIHSEETLKLILSLVMIADACRFKKDITLSFKSEGLMVSFIKNCDIHFLEKNKAKVGSYIINFIFDKNQLDNLIIKN